ncbi:MAG TPA: hypothetical protein DE179_09205 [Oceanospirillaceae bacterium]|nr:hypothetical protein [Oceanospirillaceae bacterium]
MPLLQKLPEILAQPPQGGWHSKDFAGIDQLHIGGLKATKKLLDWLPIAAQKGLDMGAGLGGCARLLALEHGCQMTASDLDADYIAAAQLLDQALSNSPNCTYVVADSLALPFAEQSFDFIISQHAMMPIADKPSLLQGAYDLLQPGGSLLLHEVYLSPDKQASQVTYPTPWAQEAAHSHLQTWDQFANMCTDMGWILTRQEDKTAQSLAWINAARAKISGAQGSNMTPMRNPLHAGLALGKQAGTMSANVAYNLANGFIEVRSALLTRLS